MGEEQLDSGEISKAKKTVVGYFSQDVGDMAGRSALAEVMDGAGPVSAVAVELAELEVPPIDALVQQLKRSGVLVEQRPNEALVGNGEKG